MVNHKSYLSGLVQVMALAGISMAAIQCSKVDEPAPPQTGQKAETVTLTLYGGSPDSKTYLGEDGQSVLWSEGDVVIINDYSYQVEIDPDNPSVATVTGVYASDEYIAYYAEYIGGYYEPDDTFDMILSKEQYYSDDSFGQWSNLMVAYSTDEDLYFQNVGGLLHFSITGNSEIKSISLSSNDGAYIAGRLTIPMDDLRNGTLKDSYEIFGYQENQLSNTIIIDGIGVQLGPEPHDFYFAVPARTYAEGITLIMEDADGNVGIQTTQNSIEVLRNEIRTVETFAFTPAQDIVLEDHAAGATSISASVSAAGGMGVKVAVMPVSEWEKFGEDEESGILAWRNILDYTEICTCTDGTAQFTLDQAYNSSGWGQNIMAETEYVLAVSYCNAAGKSIGSISISEYRLTTAEASGTEPVIKDFIGNGTFYEGGNYDNGLAFTLFTEDAAGITIIAKPTSYFNVLESTLSTQEIIARYGEILVDNLVAEANSETGCQLWFKDEIIYPGTGYTIMAAVFGEGGKMVTERLDLTADAHIPDDASWEDLMDGSMNMVLYDFGFSTMYNYQSVERIASGEKIFRISFELNQNAELMSIMENKGYVLTDTDSQYLYLQFSTIENSNVVSALPNESYTGYSTVDGQPIYFMSDSNGYYNNGEVYLPGVLAYGNDSTTKTPICRCQFMIYFDFGI